MLGNIFGNKSTKQHLTIFTGRNNVYDAKLESRILHCENPETAEGWLLNSNQMCIDEKTGEYFQFVNSKYGYPINIYRDVKKFNVDIDRISSNTEDQQMVFTEERGRKDSRLTWIGIITVLITLTTSIIIFTVIT